MCGRFTRKENFTDLAALLGLPIPPTLAPHYNIAPSQPIACVRTDPQTVERTCIELKWGLVPSWAKNGSIGNKMINARSETAAEKPSFKHAFKQQRCVVLADGFFEWKRNGKAKEPYYFRLKDRRTFCFAGLWERWDKGPDGPIETCAILTIGPNTLMEPIHHRMPVILQEKDYETWLDPKIQNPRFLPFLLQPYPPEEMEAFPVSPMVNNPRNNSERCIEPFG